MTINGIDLRHLRYFLAVTEELSFSRAALRLHISQPALSMQIQDLEQRMETPLFTRTKRKVRVTAAGQELAPRAKKLLRDMEEGLRAAQAVARGKTTELRIGTIYSAPLAPAFVKIIAHIRKIHPEVRFTFREMRTAPLLEALIGNRIDIAFGWHDALPADKRLLARVVSADQLYLCLPAQHRLASRPTLRVADLANEILFLTSLQAKMPFAHAMRQVAQAHHISLNISEEASHFPIIANLVASGCGLGIVPDYVARLATSGLVCKKLEGIPRQSMCMRLVMIRHVESEASAVAGMLSPAVLRKIGCLED